MAVPNAMAQDIIKTATTMATSQWRFFSSSSMLCSLAEDGHCARAPGVSHGHSSGQRAYWPMAGYLFIPLIILANLTVVAMIATLLWAMG